MENKEKIKEMKNFAITSLVFSVLFTVVYILLYNKGATEGDEMMIMLPIGAVVLLIIGLNLLPKALKLEKLNKNN